MIMKEELSLLLRDYTVLCLSVTISILLFVTTKLFLFSQVKIRSKKNKHNPAPPSPPRLPIIGHLHLLRAPVHRSAQRLARDYGPVVALRLGWSRRAVLVSSPGAVEECFSSHNDIVLANRPPSLLSRHVGYGQTTVSTAPYGDHWRNLRRIGAIEIFSAARLKSFSDTRAAQVHRLLLSLGHSFTSGSGSVEMKPLLSELTYSIIMTMVAGSDGAVDRDDAVRFKRIIKEVVATAAVVNPAEFLPVLGWFSGGYERKVKRLAEKTDEFLQSLVDRFRSRKESENTMIHHLLSLQHSQPEYYTDAIIKGLVMVLLLAGTDTSSVTLEWAMSNLLNHPEKLRKARAEIDAKVGSHRLVSESDLSKLDYLQNIISETLRLYPAAPLLVPHHSSDKITVGGYDVPRGTTVFVNAWSIHRDPDVWGHDAEEFFPERFESGDDMMVGRRLMPFGQGRRACPGEGLARRVVGLALGSMVQCFEWDRVGESLVDMTQGVGLTMPKLVPLVAKCKPRDVFYKCGSLPLNHNM